MLQDLAGAAGGGRDTADADVSGAAGLGRAGPALRRCGLRCGWIFPAALIVLGAWAPAAFAQDVESSPLVSNLFKELDDLGWVIETHQPGAGNAFTTGGVATGYQVMQVRMWIILAIDVDEMGLVVALHKAANGIPTDTVAHFTRSKSFREGWNALNSAEPVYLEPDSDYALVVECVSNCGGSDGGDNQLLLGRTVKLGEFGRSDWSIENRVAFLFEGRDSTDPANWWQETDVPHHRVPLLISIEGFDADIFVSNESREGDAPYSQIDGGGGVGQEFTAGDHGAGYLLKGVTLLAEESHDSQYIERSAYLYTVNEDGSRNERVVELTERGGPRLQPPVEVKFDAPSDTLLLPGERYMFVLKCDNNCGGDNFVTFSGTSRPGQSSLIDDGWKIGDHVASAEDGWAPDTSVDQALWMRVWGGFDDRPYVVDGGVAVTSTPQHTGAGDTYVRGDEIEFTLTFNEAVDVSGTPGFTFIAGVDELTAAYASGSGTEELTFVYTVVAGDLDINGLGFAGSDEAWNNPEDAVVRAGDTVTALIHFDGVGNQAGHEIRGNVVRPAITDIEITSLPLEDDTYGLGETIEVTVTLDQDVDVTTSAHGPAFAVVLGSLGFRDAGYLRQDSNRKLVFGYVVVTADSAPNGARIPRDALADAAGELRLGGAIRSQLDADLDLDSAGLTRDPDHKVDATVNNLVDTRLAELTIDPGVLAPAFDPDVTQYSVVLANSVSRVTVSATARIPSATAWILPLDADEMADGHQVDVPIGGISIQVNVQSADRAHIGTTTVQVFRNARILPPQDASADEGDGTVGVVFELSAASASPVTFDWATADGTATAGADYAAASGTVTIAAGQTAAEVTVSILDDSDDEADETFEVTLSNLAGAEAADPTAEVVIRDDDEVGGLFSTTELTVEEGGSATYELSLTAKPTGTVSVQLSLNGSTDVTFSTPSLTFTAMNWATAQTVTVAAAADDDAVADTAEIVHPLTGSGYALVIGTVSVTVQEHDTAGVSGIPDTLNVREGSNETYAVVLDSEPTGDVTVTPARSGSTDVTFSPPSLTFTTMNWATAQTVTVAAAAADDAVTDTATLTHTPSGGGYGSVAAVTATVTVNESDTAGVSGIPATVNVPEDGSTTYTVVLTSEPTANVTVTPARTGSADVTFAPPSLTFTAVNWATAQTVTVQAAADDDAVADMATLSHAVSGGGYGTVTAGSVAVTVDEDEVAGVTLTTNALTVPEDGSNTYTVVLTSEPTANVTVTPSRTGSVDVTFSPPSLAFTAVNWETAQTVTVAADDDDDAVLDTATLSHTASGGDYGTVTVGSVTVTVTEADSADVTVTPTVLVVAEGGSNTYTLVLTSAPTGDVTVTPSRRTGSSIDVTFSPPSLTFTALNWATAQTVTVEAADDDDAVDDEAVIEHAVNGANYATAEAAPVSVTVDDPHEAGVSVSERSLDIPEGESRTYQVVLESEPTGPVTVMPMHTGSEDVEIEPTSLTFTPGNWETAQTVTVEAAADDDAAADTATINHVVVGADYGSVTAAPVSVTVAESDSVGVTVSATALTVPEGETGSYRVTLDSEPTGPVTITLTKTGSDHVVPGSTTLAFTDMNWETGLAVAVDAVADDDAVDDTATIDHAVSGADYGSATAASVSVTVDDDEEAGVTLSTRALSVPEGGSNTYTVVLDSEPTANVTVTPARAAGGSTDVTFATSTLTFTPGNWETAQTVTVEAADDTDVAVDTATLTHAVSGGDYGTVTAGAVEVTVTEAQASGVTVMPTQLTVPEGFARTYEVSLDAAPAGTLTVTPSLGGEDDVTTATSTLTFTPTDWDAQTVTVTAPHDADAFDETVTIANVVTLPGGGTALASDVVVTVEDDDASDLIVTDVGEFVRTPGMSLGKLELCWRPEGVAVGEIEDFQYREKTRDPLVIPGLNGPIEPYNTDHTGFGEWQAAPDNAAADCADGLGFRLHDRHVNVIKTYQVRGRHDGAWLESGAALGVTVDAVQEFKAQVVGAASWPEVMSEVPEPVCADYDDDLTTADEAGSFIVGVFFQTAPWSSVQKPEPVTGFDLAADLELVNATAAVLPGGYHPFNGYRVLVTPTTFGEPVQVGVPAGVATSLLTSSVNTASGTFERSTGTLADCEPGVTVPTTALAVSFGKTFYKAREGGEPATVKVQLNPAPTSSVTIPLRTENRNWATDADYSGVPPSVTFGPSERVRTFTVTVQRDNDIEDAEEVRIGFGTLPPGVVAGSPAWTSVALEDDLSVSFGAASYTAAEGGAGVTVTVRLTRSWGAPFTLPLTVEWQGGASTSDYSGIPGSVVFRTSDLEKTFTVTAVDDAVNDDGESVEIGFGWPRPQAIWTGAPSTATVQLVDNDNAQPEGALRLAQGAGVYGGSYGRLQVYHDGRWGLVCDTNFDELGARVACRQLGFVDGEEGYGGAGSGGLPFWLKGVECGGTESRLVNCPHWGLKKHSCGSFHIVGLECSRTPLSVTDARVAGALLTLSYDAALDGGSVPSGRDFVVTADAPDGASAVPVTAVAVDGDTVSLTLARGVLPDERVRLSYLVAPMHPVQDISGGPAAPLTDLAVRNETEPGAKYPDVAVRNETEPGARTLEVARSLDAVVAGALQPLLVIQHDGAAPGGTLSLPAEALVAGRAQPAPLDLSPWLAAAGASAPFGRLDLSSRALADLSALAGLTQLRVLNLSDNALADLASLSGLTGLRVLDLSSNAVADLSPLAGLTGLERLDLSGNRIADVSTLSGLTRLQVLLLDGNRIDDVLPLWSLQGLVHLGLADNRIAEVGLLAELGSLQRLDLTRNRVSDVSPLGDLSELVWLRLPGNPVSDTAPLGRLTLLRWLWLDAEATVLIGERIGRRSAR